MIPWDRTARLIEGNGVHEWINSGKNLLGNGVTRCAEEPLHHPRDWDRAEVISWIKTCKEQYALDDFDFSKFGMNGKGLCMLNRENFIDRHHGAGDLLYNTLQALIAACNKIAEGRPERDSFHIDRWRSPPHLQYPYPTQLWQSVSLQPPIPSPSISQTNGVNGHLITSSPTSAIDLRNNIGEDVKDLHDTFDEDYKDCRLLWDFIARILTKSTTSVSCVRWESEKELIFRIMEPAKLAQLWGRNKKKANMTYEKLSRALRYYYKLQILRKVPGKKLTYQFLVPPESILKSGKGRLQSRFSDASNTGQKDGEIQEFKTINEMEIEENLSDHKSDSISSAESEQGDLVIKYENEGKLQDTIYKSERKSPENVFPVFKIPEKDHFSVVKCVYNGQIYNGDTNRDLRICPLQINGGNELKRETPRDVMPEEMIHFKKKILLPCHS